MFKNPPLNPPLIGDSKGNCKSGEQGLLNLITILDETGINHVSQIQINRDCRDPPAWSPSLRANLTPGFPGQGAIVIRQDFSSWGFSLMTK
jgi:hypothetical protein